jgi:hypothetical protein
MTAHFPAEVDTRPSDVIAHPVAVADTELVSIAYDTIPLPEPPDEVSTSSVPYVPVVLVTVKVL